MTGTPTGAGLVTPTAPTSATETVAPLTGRSGLVAKYALRIGLAALLLILLFYQVKWQDVWTAVRTVDATLFFAACLMWVPNQYLQFVKWDILARMAGDGVSRADIHRGYWVGHTLGVITPGRVGQFGRGMALHNCSLSRALGLTAVERGYTAIAVNGLALLAVLLLPILGWIPPVPIPTTASVVCGAAGVSLLLLGIFPRFMLPPLRWIVRRLPMREKLEQAVEVLAPTDPGRGVLYLILALAATATALFQFVLLIRAMGVEIPIVAGMFVAVLTFFLKGSIPISIASLGIGEWTAVLCYKGLGVQPSVAVAASLLLFTMNVFVPGLIGLPFIGKLRVPHLSISRSTTA
jgi:uncharacterized membrane protein YbhN (UPF0104 family)